MSPSELRSVLHQLSTGGFAVRRAAPISYILGLLEQLGRVIHVEEITPSEGSTALLKSRRALPLHTDHYRADLILWHCLANSSPGGETVLVDGRAVYKSLSAGVKELLAQICLTEHSVFRNDPGKRALVTWQNGEPDIYYSFWLRNENDPPDLLNALEEFDSAAQDSTPIEIVLDRGDVLVVDNHRMLHGRTEIGSEGERHLRRYWLERA